MMNKLAAAVAMLAMTIQPVLAAPAACLTSADMRAAAHFVMPVLINGVTAKCSPSLGAASYLTAKGPDLVKRYEALPGDDSAAIRLIKRFDDKGEIDGMTADELRVFLKVGLAKAMGKDLTPENCRKVDKVLAILDPMPAENTVALVEFIVLQVEAGEAKKAKRLGKPFEAKICPAP
jgi:hypothetical protein